MTQNFHIEGMTCGSCQRKVEESLSSLPGISSIDIDRENSSVSIESSEPFNPEALQSVLPQKYTLRSSAAPAKPSELRQLFPLFLIFGYITATSVILNIHAFSVANFMLVFMGLFYIVFSFFKLLDLKGFQGSFQMYDPLTRKLPFYGRIYPFLELTLGILFLTRTQIQLALISTLIILGITTIGVVKVLLEKKSIQCACLGTTLNLPMTKATFIENSIMMIMAIFMLII